MDLEIHHAHPWDLAPRQAMQVQRELVGYVRQEPLAESVETVAGLDVSIRGDRARATVVVVKLPTLEPVAQTVHEAEVPFPYIPGLLSFREVPVLLPALAQLDALPDVLMADGQGRAHGRRFGLACHLGVLLDRPALGVAKKRLVGRHDEPDPEKGAHVPLVHRGEVVGEVVRTRTDVKPVFVSVGHRMTLDEAVRLTLATTTRYKIPEPTRLAHKLSKGS